MGPITCCKICVPGIVQLGSLMNTVSGLQWHGAAAGEVKGNEACDASRYGGYLTGRTRPAGQIEQQQHMMSVFL